MDVPAQAESWGSLAHPSCSVKASVQVTTYSVVLTGQQSFSLSHGCLLESLVDIHGSHT